MSVVEIARHFIVGSAFSLSIAGWLSRDLSVGLVALTLVAMAIYLKVPSEQ